MKEQRNINHRVKSAKKGPARKQGKINLALAFVTTFVGMVLAILVLFVVIPDRNYSESERRNLEQTPTLSVDGLTSGKYEKKLETYIADQFPFRDRFVALKTTADRMLGKIESNSIFMGKNGWLMQDFDPVDEEYYQNSLNAMRDFAAEYPNLTHNVLVAPTSVLVYQNQLPFWAKTGDQGAYLDRLGQDCRNAGLNFVDIREAMIRESAERQLYYKTDHHWTTAGAHLAYEQLAAVMSLPGLSVLYQPMLVCDSFEGTLISSSGFYTGKKDSIYVYEPQNVEQDYTVGYVDLNERSASCYKTEALSGTDPYTVFFGGNYGLIQIDSKTESDRIALVFKDSYANSLIPFLIPDFNKIFIIDPRYYNESVRNLLATYSFTDIIYIYNAKSFAQDAYLPVVLAASNS